MSAAIAVALRHSSRTNTTDAHVDDVDGLTPAHSSRKAPGRFLTSMAEGNAALTALDAAAVAGDFCGVGVCFRSARGVSSTCSPPSLPRRPLSASNVARDGNFVMGVSAGRPVPRCECKAWAIADGDTGSLLAGCRAGLTLQIASITKVMTAYLILGECETKPKVLNELVVVGDRAARTKGTTARLRSGEVYTVSDLLYGLMLPSGNDAAVALAAYFGGRAPSCLSNCSPGAVKHGNKRVYVCPTEDEAVRAFVRRMNKQARHMGLVDTYFANVHGLGDPQLRSTARDVCRLGFEAMKLARFRRLVATVEHECTVLYEADRDSVNGNLVGLRPACAPRPQRWTNTNDLLPGHPARAEVMHDSTDGPQEYCYDGLKTGITSAAGGCLLSSIRIFESGRRLVVTVLGAPSKVHRFTETERLVRWAVACLASEGLSDFRNMGNSQPSTARRRRTCVPSRNREHGSAAIAAGARRGRQGSCGQAVPSCGGSALPALGQLPSSCEGGARKLAGNSEPARRHCASVDVQLRPHLEDQRAVVAN